MIFNSLTFLLFFAIVLVLHNLPFSWTIKKINLMVASYIFYAAWNPPLVALLWLATIVDWHVAQAIVRAQDAARKKFYLFISLAVNLGLLGYFKYGGFLLESFTAALHAAGIEYHAAAPDIVLPIGISFYTFVTLSYTIDVYRGEIKPSRSFLDFALLVTFFPHLVAGPILRAVDFLPQCETPRRANRQQIAWGLVLLIVGLFEKMVLADGVFGPIADQVYDGAQLAGGVDAWIGTFAFAGQIYCDFNGYSLAAIGVALCLGFVFPDNFRFPYAAIWFSDFWRRWHISLSSWLRDYLYIPLGGNRRGEGRTYANLMLTMLIGGLWHGASWMFVLWGGLHGFYLVVERALRAAFESRKPKWQSVTQLPVAVMSASVITFLAVCVTWVFFRARSLSDAFHLVKVMVSGGKSQMEWHSPDSLNILGLTAALLVTHWLLRNSSLEEAASRFPFWGRALILVFMLLCIAFAPGDNRAFIYFQF